MDTLIEDVATVQEYLKELRNSVDANSIYFKLETNHFRADRVLYVVNEIRKELNLEEVTPIIDLTSEASTSSQQELLNNEDVLPLPELFCDLNNNDPNNNIDYEPLPPLGIDVAENKQEELRQLLLKEARAIQEIVPNQSLEQIYSFLETNVECEWRVQLVALQFILSGLPPEALQSVENGPLKSKLEIVRPIRKEKQGTTYPDSEVLQNASNSTRVFSTSSFDVPYKVRKVQKKRVPVTAAIGCAPPENHLSTSSLDGDVSKPPVSEIKQTPFSISDAVINKSSGNRVTVNEPVQGFPYSPEANKRLPGQEPALSFSGTHEPNRQPLLQIPCYSGTGIQKSVIKEPVIPERAPVQLIPAVPGSSKQIPQPESLPHTSKQLEPMQTMPSHAGTSWQIQRLDVDPSSLPTGNSEAINIAAIPPEHLRALQDIFVDIDIDYLKSLEYRNDPAWIDDTVVKLLQTDYPRRPAVVIEEVDEAGSSTPDEVQKTIEMHYQNVLAVLPNADPTYIRQKVEEMAGNDDAVKVFVAEAMELKNYPTLKDYLKRQEVQALQQKFTEQFNVSDFLEIFPDPFKYFMDEKKNTTNMNLQANYYLKKRYDKIRCASITACYMKHKGNLTRTCMELDKCTHFMKGKRQPSAGTDGAAEVNIPFLQEVCFIENRTKIQEYIAAKKAKKEAAFMRAKDAGDLMVCDCCYNEEVLIEDMKTCSEGHTFCNECVQKGAEVQIGEGKTSFPCFVDCPGEFSLKTLQSVLKPSVFSCMLHRKQLEEVKAADIPGLETCPFCEFATIPDENDRVFHCLNPDCMKDSCRLCREPNHVPLRCNEVEKSDEVRLRTYIENRMTEALVRTCCKCGTKFIKSDGCNKMTCSCGASMCYICRAPVRDYSHFNGPGGAEFRKCPLYTNNAELHVNAVKKEAQKAKAEAKAANPNVELKYDPTTALPKASKSMSSKKEPRRVMPRVHMARVIPIVPRVAAGVAGLHQQREVRINVREPPLVPAGWELPLRAQIRPPIQPQIRPPIRPPIQPQIRPPIRPQIIDEPLHRNALKRAAPGEAEGAPPQQRRAFGNYRDVNPIRGGGGHHGGGLHGGGNPTRGTVGHHGGGLHGGGNPTRGTVGHHGGGNPTKGAVEHHGGGLHGGGNPTRGTVGHHGGGNPTKGAVGHHGSGNTATGTIQRVLSHIVPNTNPLKRSHTAANANDASRGAVPPLPSHERDLPVPYVVAQDGTIFPNTTLALQRGVTIQNVPISPSGTVPVPEVGSIERNVPNLSSPPATDGTDEPPAHQQRNVSQFALPTTPQREVDCSTLQPNPVDEPQQPSRNPKGSNS